MYRGHPESCFPWYKNYVESTVSNPEFLVVLQDGAASLVFMTGSSKR
jgi:hypothetical protein